MNLSDRRNSAETRSGLQKLGEGRAWAYTRAGLTLGIVLGAGAVGTMAAWSDSATATSGTFSAGEVEVVDLKINGDAPDSDFVAMNRSSMLRGQSVAGVLDVQNTGTADFNWSMSAQTTGAQALIEVLQVGLYAGPENDGSTCEGPQIGSTVAMSPSPTLATERLLASGHLR
ncbi:SipW-dependent-type signal peptide-containing protein [Dietzia aurantiaca]|uniref:SipW-dependent-type signal peptide-containing protein n=1 Tax=Dietzia aurantiaca TaxID=983873 RepID=A0ABV9PML6_9ACTN